MVTRRVIRIITLEDDAAKESSAAVDSSNTNKQTTQPKKPKTPLCNHPDCTKHAQHPSPLCWKHGAQNVTCKFTGCNKKGILLGLCPDHGGLVQLCRWRGCINEVDLEKRGGLVPYIR